VGSYEFLVCLGARNAGLFLGCWFLIHGALLIKREQTFENLFVGKIDRKTVGVRDGAIEFRVGLCENAIIPPLAGDGYRCLQLAPREELSP
jgi:hypothetical protein